MDFVNANQQWMQQQIEASASSDPYWYQVRFCSVGGEQQRKINLSSPPCFSPSKVQLVLQQLNGLVAGYAEHRDPSVPPLNATQLLLMQMAFDLGDVTKAVDPSKVSERPEKIETGVN